MTALILTIGTLLACGAAVAFVSEALLAWRGLRSAWARRPR